MLLPDCAKISIGHIVKPHGVKGELSVMLDQDFDFSIELSQPVIIEIDGLDVPFFVASVRPRGLESILLTLDEIKSDVDASKLSGKELYMYVPTEMLDDMNESGIDELTADKLVGYTIINDSVTIGRIADITEIGPDCWYFVLENTGKLIPIADEMIRGIDHNKKTVDMNLPQGLLDI